MREISVRQFQQNFHKELKDLPFVVTKHGYPFVRVEKMGKMNVVTPVTPNVVTNVVTMSTPSGIKKEKSVQEHTGARCSYYRCMNWAAGQDKVNGKWFCKEHL